MKKVSIMPIGDSITYGILDGKTESGGYRRYLWQALTTSGYAVDFVGTQTNGPPSIDRNHAGYRGQRIEQISSSVNDQIIRKNPEVILLLAGTNDILQNRDVTQAPQRLSHWIDQILSDLPGTTLLVGTLPPNTRSDDYPQQIRNFNAALTKIIDRKKHQDKPVMLVDLYTRLTNRDLQDQTHPTAEGYKKMAQAWYEALTDVLYNIDDVCSVESYPSDYSSNSPVGDRVIFSGVTKTQALRSSTLAGKNYDRLTDFFPRQGDRIQLDFDDNLTTLGQQERPMKLFNAGIQIEQTLEQATRAAYKDANPDRRGNQTLKPDQAVIFQYRSNFYLALNNDRPGFQFKSDLFVDLGKMTRSDFAPGDVHTGLLTVTDYFV